MCEKPKQYPENTPPPKSAEELLALRNCTMWITGDRCPKCFDILYTNGTKVWCVNRCYDKGKYESFQEDYIK